MQIWYIKEKMAKGIVLLLVIIVMQDLVTADPDAMLKSVQNVIRRKVQMIQDFRSFVENPKQSKEFTDFVNSLKSLRRELSTFISTKQSGLESSQEKLNLYKVRNVTLMQLWRMGIF